MNDAELATQIAQRFMLMEAEIEARGALLDRCWKRPDPWQGLAYDQSSEILNGQKHLTRIAEFQTASNAASGDGSLIRILHEELLHKVAVPL